MYDARQAALIRNAAVETALQQGGSEAAIRVLRRYRRQALRNGDIEEAADCLAVLWSLSVCSPDRQLRFARARAKEAPSTPSLLGLGHALMICGRAHAARRAYERAIELAAVGPESVRDLDQVIAEEARAALQSLDENRVIPFVEAVKRQRAPTHLRYAEAYERSKQRALDAPSTDAFQNLGVAHELLGRADEALDAYKRALAFAASEGSDAVYESLKHKVRALERDRAERSTKAPADREDP
jgi:tetratricopeptide (TPR) repeat protein